MAPEPFQQMLAGRSLKKWLRIQYLYYDAKIYEIKMERAV
jgi:hypothetical protein